MGISAGPVFVGSLGDEGRWTYTVLGDEVNVAARLMEQAGWGQVVVSGRVCKRVGERGRFTPLGLVAVKGKQELLPAFLCTGVHERPAALTAHALVGPGEIVGRQSELARLEEIARRSMAGQVQVLVLEGEAGVGKSRLLGELARRWLEWGGQGYRGDCYAYAHQTPYHPWSEILRAVIGLRTGEPADVQWQQILAYMQRVRPDLVERLPLLADLLGLPAEENALTRHLQGAERKRALFDLVLELIRYLARAGPLLLILEDAHWSDESSLELVEHLALRLEGLPVLVALAQRPPEEPLPGYLRLRRSPRCAALVLEPLPPDTSAALARRRLGIPADVPLPAALQSLLERAQGNPLFVEEILNTLEDAGVRVVLQEEECLLLGNLAAVEIPETVQALVRARLDRLEEASQLVLKVAAVVGSSVPYSALRAIYPVEVSEAELESSLADLERLGLLYEAGGPERTVLFRHFLIQEVAYESLLFAQRRALHGALGRHLEGRYAGDLEPVVDLLAYHYHRAGERDKALTYLLQAGDRAARAYNNHEALACYLQAQGWLAGETPPEQRWEVLLRLEQVLDALGQREEQRQAQQELEGLALALADPRRLAEVRCRQGALLVHSGHPQEGTAILRQAGDLAQQVGDPALAGRCLVTISRACWLRGDAAGSLQALEEARALFREAGSQEGEAVVLSQQGNIYLALNSQYERCLEAFCQVREIYRSRGDPLGEMRASVNVAIALLLLGESEQALEMVRPAAVFYERSGDLVMRGTCWLVTGHALMNLEDWDAAREAARRALALLEAAQEHNFLIEGEGLCGRILLQQGRPEEALAHFRRAVALAEAGGQVLDAVRYRSYEALALLRLGRSEEALEISMAGLSLLEEQGGRMDDLQVIYWHHFLIWQQVKGAEASLPYLERAYAAVQEMAGEISDPSLRRSFLERLPWNRQIVAAWEAMGRGK